MPTLVPTKQNNLDRFVRNISSLSDNKDVITYCLSLTENSQFEFESRDSVNFIKKSNLWSHRACHTRSYTSLKSRWSPFVKIWSFCLLNHVTLVAFNSMKIKVSVLTKNRLQHQNHYQNLILVRFLIQKLKPGFGCRLISIELSHAQTS